MAVLAGAAAAGAAAEELVYRRLLPVRDPFGSHKFGWVRGREVEVESFDGTRLHAEVFDSPEHPEDVATIVFVHGFTHCMDVWHYQLMELRSERDLRLIAFDARGHGRSGPARGPKGSTAFSPDTLAQDLWAVVHQTGAAPCVVVGHSMGGMTVQSLVEFARDFPEELGSHVKGLVLVNTTFTAELGLWRDGNPRFQAARKAVLGAWEALGQLGRLRMPPGDLAMLVSRIGFGPRPSATHVAFTAAMAKATPGETMAAAVPGLSEFDGVRGLESIDVPVLVLAGDRDVVTPVWLAREMVDRIPEAELVVFEGVGHMAMLERHREVTRLVSDFARRVLR
ncbi:MAG TPA: alpha/beta hydrolase [Actinomycetota bacterium]|nr:alpha/beta hydrolase [Actinomycetota bacterium]